MRQINAGNGALSERSRTATSGVAAVALLLLAPAAAANIGGSMYQDPVVFVPFNVTLGLVEGLVCWLLFRPGGRYVIGLAILCNIISAIVGLVLLTPIWFGVYEVLGGPSIGTMYTATALLAVMLLPLTLAVELPVFWIGIAARLGLAAGAAAYIKRAMLVFAGVNVATVAATSALMLFVESDFSLYTELRESSVSEVLAGSGIEASDTWVIRADFADTVEIRSLVDSVAERLSIDVPTGTSDSHQWESIEGVSDPRGRMVPWLGFHTPPRSIIASAPESAAHSGFVFEDESADVFASQVPVRFDRAFTDRGWRAEMLRRRAEFDQTSLERDLRLAHDGREVRGTIRNSVFVVRSGGSTTPRTSQHFSIRSPFAQFHSWSVVRLDESRVIVSLRGGGLAASGHSQPLLLIDFDRKLRAEISDGTVIGVFAGRRRPVETGDDPVGR